MGRIPIRGGAGRTLQAERTARGLFWPIFAHCSTCIIVSTLFQLLREGRPLRSPPPGSRKPQSPDPTFSAIALFLPWSHTKWPYPQTFWGFYLYGSCGWTAVSKPGCTLTMKLVLLVAWGQDCRESEFVSAEGNTLEGAAEDFSLYAVVVTWNDIVILFCSTYFLKLLNKQAWEGASLRSRGSHGRESFPPRSASDRSFSDVFCINSGIPTLRWLFLNKTIDWKRVCFQRFTQELFSVFNTWRCFSCPKIISIWPKCSGVLAALNIFKSFGIYSSQQVVLRGTYWPGKRRGTLFSERLKVNWQAVVDHRRRLGTGHLWQPLRIIATLKIVRRHHSFRWRPFQASPVQLGVQSTRWVSVPSLFSVSGRFFIDSPTHLGLCSPTGLRVISYSGMSRWVSLFLPKLHPFNLEGCDGGFYVSTWLACGLPRELVIHYF